MRQWLLVFLTLCCLWTSGCREGRRTEERPPSRPAGPAPARQASPTPPARPAAAAERIPPPPLRMDARVHAEELALLPAGASLVVTGRSDLLDRLLAPRGWLGHHLDRIPGWSRIAAAGAGAESPSRRLGLDPRRQWAAALLYFDGAEAKTLEAALEKRAGRPGSPAPAAAALPPLRMRARLVFPLADPARARATLASARAALAGLGWKGLRAPREPGLPPALGALASKGAALLHHGPDGVALVAWVIGKHLVIDLALSVTGPFGPSEAAALLSPPGPEKAAAAPLDDPFGRVVLLSDADLTVLVDPSATAEAACWLGMREALRALRNATPAERPRLLDLAWRVARTPRRFAAAAPHPFDRFAATVHLTGREPQVALTWRLTTEGTRLVAGVARPLAGRDLGRGRRFVDTWLRPLAAAADKVLPPTGPWADPALPERLVEGGALGYLVIAARSWPRLLPARPVRKRLLAFARQELGLEGLVGRVNVEHQGALLRTRIEGRPLSAGAGGGRRPPAPRGRPPAGR